MSKITVKFKKFDPKTKQGKLFNALIREREVLTPAQITKRFGIKNISAEVSRIKSSGYAVYTRNRTAGNGVHVTEYEMGKPSREIVARNGQAKS